MLTALSALTAEYLEWAINNHSLLSLFYLTPVPLSITLCYFYVHLQGHISMGEVHWFRSPCTTPPAILSSLKCWLPSLQSKWLPQAGYWVWLRWDWGVTRRLRGDMKLCPQWCAPCAAFLGSSTASLVSDNVVEALLANVKMVLTEMYLKSSDTWNWITEKCDFKLSQKASKGQMLMIQCVV